MKQDATNQIGCYILHQCEIIPVSFVPGFLLSRCLLLLLFHWTVVSEIVIWNKCLLIQQCTVYEFERIYVCTGTCINEINKLFSDEHDIVKSRCSAGIFKILFTLKARDCSGETLTAALTLISELNSTTVPKVILRRQFMTLVYTHLLRRLILTLLYTHLLRRLTEAESSSSSLGLDIEGWATAITRGRLSSVPGVCRFKSYFTLAWGVLLPLNARSFINHVDNDKLYIHISSSNNQNMNLCSLEHALLKKFMHVSCSSKYLNSYELQECTKLVL